MRLLRVAPFFLLSVCAIAQESPAPVEPQQQPPAFRTTVDYVIAPVVVRDRDGNYVNGLQPSDFRLFDNGKEQNIHVDVAYQPISLVIAIQANDHVEAVLPQIQKIGSLIQPLVVGEAGEVAVLKFDHRLEVVQDFTSDATAISQAVKKIRPGSSVSRLTDAIDRSAFLLRNRPRERRRIVLLISETRDYGSEGRAREALINAQLNNVTVYSVNISRLVTTLTRDARPARPNPLPPAARPLPPNVAATPTAVQQTYGEGGGGRAEFLPLMIEILRDVKAVFKDNPVELFTKGTGGTEYGFTRQRGLEEAISRVGEELHSQYLITYTPNNREEGGFHEIDVQVPARRDVKIHTRPGYWLAARVDSGSQ
ncbi:MAG: VWA domain-containing protein [Bryobacteraceae bacterium]